MCEEIAKKRICSYSEVPSCPANCACLNFFPYFSSKTYVVGTQKTHLYETVILSNQIKYLNWWKRKYSKFHAQPIYLYLSAIVKTYNLHEPPNLNLMLFKEFVDLLDQLM